MITPSKRGVVPVPCLRSYELLRLEYVHPGQKPIMIAGVILDATNDSVWMQFITDWSGYDDDELLLLRALEEDLIEKSREIGGAALVRYLSDTLSNAILISDPKTIRAENPQSALNDVFGQKAVLIPALLAVPSPVLLKWSGISRNISRNVQVAAAVAAAAFFMASVVKLGKRPVVSAKPQFPSAIARHKNLSAVKNLTAFIVPTTHIAVKRAARRRVRSWHIRHAPSLYFVPQLAVTSIRQAPLLFDHAEIILTSTPNLHAPEIDELVFPGAPERRGRRVLQALTTPFRKIGRILAE